MSSLLVVSSLSDWPFDAPGVRIVTARDYLTGTALRLQRRGSVYNLYGLYGVDLKSTAHGPMVVEVNDNPSIDAGYEDALLKNRLYDALMSGLRRRVESGRPCVLGCSLDPISERDPRTLPGSPSGARAQTGCARRQYAQ